MSFRTIFLIITLAATTGFLVLVAVENDRRVQEKMQASQITPALEKPVNKNSELFFVPSSFDIGKDFVYGENGQISSEIFLNSHEENVSAVQIELLFDPKVIDKISIDKPNNLFFFGNNEEYKILFNNADLANGRVSFAVASIENSDFKKGVGKVATISFSVKQDAQAENNQSQIVFLDKTMVSSPNTKESMLKTYSHLTIKLKSAIPTLPQTQSPTPLPQIQ